MAYKNVLVSELVPVSYYPAKEEGDSRDFFEGIPVNTKLHAFVTALRKQPTFRNCKFGVRHHILHTESELFIYHPNQIFTMGLVGYADYSVGDSVRYAYKVESHNIYNNKYHRSRPSVHWSLTDKLDRAVSNAKKYLRPYTPQEILSATWAGFGDSLRETGYKYRESLQQAYSAVSNATNNRGGIVMQELINLVNSGYKFKIPGVEKLIHDVIEVEKEFQDANNTQHRIAMVYTEPKANEESDPTFVVVELSEAGISVLNSTFIDTRATKIEHYKRSAIPEHLVGKINLLTMVDSNHFVEGVGYKALDKLFYVLV